MKYHDPYHKKVEKAGFVEKEVQIGSVRFNYAEGPKNGPALLLLHAQHMDWFSYSRVLPALSRFFHIFAVDYHGHGKTLAPASSMNANQIGYDLAQLVKTVIREPVFVSGNSSGGVLTAWLAANEPDWVQAILLEDPALLSSECPRLHSTIADKSFSMCSEFLRRGEEDFLLYWIANCRDFFKKYVGFDVAPILTASIRRYRQNNPDQPVEIFYLPGIVRLMIRGMSSYDPHFGAAFHEDSWNEGFDHAETLARIRCPALLLHARTEIMEDGTLNGAMSQEEAERIVSLIPCCEYLKIDALHVVHIDKSRQFIQILEKFFLK